MDIRFYEHNLSSVFKFFLVTDDPRRLTFLLILAIPTLDFLKKFPPFQSKSGFDMEPVS